jgi:hypothetical protein
MRRKPSHMPTGRLQSLRLFSTLLPRFTLNITHRQDISSLVFFRSPWNFLPTLHVSSANGLKYPSSISHKGLKP